MTNTFRNRHRRSVPSPPTLTRFSRVQEAGEPFVVHDNNRGLPNWRPIRPKRPVTFASPPFSEDSYNDTNVLRLQTYDWGITISDCTASCGGGTQSVTIFCHAGHRIVDNSLCDPTRMPAARNAIRNCNQQPCRGR